MNRVIRAILFPPVWFRWIFSVTSFFALGAVFFFGLTNRTAAYLIFAASALGAYYFITAAVIPLIILCSRGLMSIPLARKLLVDELLRDRVMIYGSLLLNVVFALLRLIPGIMTDSWWDIAVGLYYVTLILLRFIIVRHDLRAVLSGRPADLLEEWKAYRRTGWLMLLSDIALAGVTLQIDRDKRSFFYPGFTIFAMAAYTFYSITTAVMRYARDKKENTPLFAASMIIDLSIAVVSVFTLQTAMFSAFSPELDPRVPNTVVGALVTVITTVLAVVMILRSGRNIRRIKGERAAE